MAYYSVLTRKEVQIHCPKRRALPSPDPQSYMWTDGKVSPQHILGPNDGARSTAELTPTHRLSLTTVPQDPSVNTPVQLVYFILMLPLPRAFWHRWLPTGQCYNCFYLQQQILYNITLTSKWWHLAYSKLQQIDSLETEWILLAIITISGNPKRAIINNISILFIHPWSLLYNIN